MSDTPLVDRIADAVLYEGYTLYPYRPSVKSQQRWTFGGLLPRGYCETHGNHERWRTQTQCLVQTMADVGWTMADGEKPDAPQEAPDRDAIGPQISLRARFLHLIDRTVGELDTPAPALGSFSASTPVYHNVDRLRIGERVYQPWQEAEQRDIDVPAVALAELVQHPRTIPFVFPSRHTTEPLRNEAGQVVGLLIRDQRAIAGEVTVSAEPTAHAGLFRLTATVSNRTDMDDPGQATRDEAVLHSLASTHLVLHTEPGGAFVSMIDPPAEFRDAADLCKNHRCWPVLVGEAGDRDTVLAAPIILYDYPQIAPQSPGDLFDGTEIDEILSLRIMTLTDEEKRDAAATDDRVRALIERTESLTRQQLMSLHGTMQSEESLKSEVGSLKDQDTPEAPFPDFPTISHPTSSISHSEKPTTARVGDVEVRRGDRVRLNPTGSADVLDVVLRGMTATIADIEQDLEDRVHLAVTIDEDPGADFGMAGKPGHRFFFTPDDVEPLPSKGDAR